ncbi:MAG: PaaI family thioesterase [Hyphomicrobiaceae bacterium]
MVTRSFALQGLMQSIGARLTRIESGHVTITVPFSDRVSQQHGLFHGAVIGAIGDSAGGYAALTQMPADSEVVTIEYKVNFVRPAKGRALIADGTVLRSGKSITVCRVDVDVEDDAGSRTLVAVLQATFMRVAKQA